VISTAEGGRRRVAASRAARSRSRAGRAEIELSRELHDHVSQTLNLLLLEMEIFKAEQIGRAGVLRELDRIQSSIRTVLANVREIVHDIRMDEATVEDMRASLNFLAERLESSARINVNVSVSQDWPSNLRPREAVNLLRIVEEAAHNSVIHGSPSQLWIELGVTPEHLTASIRDDGRGMITGIAAPGLGIRGMRERAGLLGGALKIDSEPGKGTQTVIEIPRLRAEPLAETPAEHPVAAALAEAHTA